MYASDNALRCDVCGKQERSVRKRHVACHDGCDQGIRMTVCDECAREMDEETGDDE